MLYYLRGVKRNQQPEAMRTHWKGFSALTYDVVDCTMENILTSEGLALLVRQICRVRACGIVLMAPVCSSWSWMSRFSTQRSIIEPLGNDTSESVAAGNLMVSRMVLLMSLIVARGSIFIIEQPQGSIMLQHPRFQHFIKHNIVWKVLLGEPATCALAGLTCALQPSSLRRYAFEAYLLSKIGVGT